MADRPGSDQSSDEPDARPRVGIVGAGRVGSALAIAIDRAGWPVVAVSSRDADRRARIARALPRARLLDDPPSLVSVVDLVLLAVPDDVIATVASGIRLRAGQAIVHTSGALASDILAPALVPGTAAASFHPLMPFADLDQALAALADVSIAIEGDEDLVSILAALATDLGARPIRIPAAGKAAYHAAAVLAAGGFVALLDVIAELARVGGMDPPTALEVYAPLIRAGLANGASLGIPAALTGPIVRGDVHTVELHLRAIDLSAPDARDLYLAMARRQLALSRSRGDLDDRQVAMLSAVLIP